MSDCEKYIELISAMTDGEVTDEEKKLVTEHIETCENCRAFLEICGLSSETLSDDLAEPPGELLSGVMAKLPEKRRNMKRVYRYVSVAACLLILVGAAAASPLMGGMKKSASKADSIEEIMIADDCAPAEAPAADEDYGVVESCETEMNYDSANIPVEGYRTVITVYGEIPDGCEALELEEKDGIRICEIDEELAQKLIKQGYEVSVYPDEPDLYLLILVG